LVAKVSGASAWHNWALTVLIGVSVAMFGTIAWTITQIDLTLAEITLITGLLINVTGILLGLTGLSPFSKTVERMKIQVSLAITCLLWLLAVVMVAQTSGPPTTISNATLRYFFLFGITLFMALVVIYSVSTVEATRQRLIAFKERGVLG
jgi:peptidoglycan/LPS O-acetylase OafA/YrhL